MKRFDYGIELDPKKLAEQTVGEQHKFIDSKTGGKQLKTSAASSVRGSPGNLTIFSVSDILQGIPQYSSPQEVLGKYEDLMSREVALGLHATDGGEKFSDYTEMGLLTGDVQRNIQSLEIIEQINAGTLDAATAGTSAFQAGQGIVTIDMLKNHPKILGMSDDFKKDAENGKISPNILWLIKFLADSGVPIVVIAGLKGHQDPPPIHTSGRSVHLSVIDGGGDITANRDLIHMYDLILTLHGAGVRRPLDVTGPTPLPVPLPGGTSWFTQEDHRNKVHISYAVFEGPAGIDMGVQSGAGTGAEAVGDVPVGAAPPITSSKSNIDFVRQALSQLGDEYEMSYHYSNAISNDNPTMFDCSELVHWAAGRVGVVITDGADQQRAACAKANLLLPVNEAALIPGCLVFHPGHVAITLGDGKQTIEAMGEKYGVLKGNIGNRFSAAGRLPGMNYFTGTSPTGGGAASGAKVNDLAHIQLYLKGLREHESSNRYDAKSTSSSASGAYQYIDSTWDNYAGFARAYLAPVAVQDERATKDATNGFNSLKDWRLVAMEHYYPKFRKSGEYDKVPPGNRLTMNQYADSVCKYIPAAGAPAASSTVPSAGKDLLAALQQNVAGLVIEEVGDWRARVAKVNTAGSADSTAAPAGTTQEFTPVGIMLHHTATAAAGELPTRDTLINGRQGLPGPLCQIAIGRSGKVYLITQNYANHPGWGSQTVLNEVNANVVAHGTAGERNLPDDAYGNRWFYGIEVENSGSQPYPQAQIDALVKVCVAICKHHGWNVSRIIHHREWTQRKTDMSYFGPGQDVRAQVQTQL